MSFVWTENNHCYLNGEERGVIIESCVGWRGYVRRKEGKDSEIGPCSDKKEIREKVENRILVEDL